MLTADLVNARRRGAELHLTKVSDETRARANQLAARSSRFFAAASGDRAKRSTPRWQRSKRSPAISASRPGSSSCSRIGQPGALPAISSPIWFGARSSLERPRPCVARPRSAFRPRSRSGRGGQRSAVRRRVGRARALRRSAGDERALRVRSGDPRRAGSSIRGRSGTSGALARGARGHRCPSSFSCRGAGACFADSNFLGLLHSICRDRGRLPNLRRWPAQLVRLGHQVRSEDGHAAPDPRGLGIVDPLGRHTLGQGQEPAHFPHLGRRRRAKRRKSREGEGAFVTRRDCRTGEGVFGSRDRVESDREPGGARSSGDRLVRSRFALFASPPKDSTSKCWASGVAKRCFAASTSFGAGSPKKSFLP